MTDTPASVSAPGRGRATDYTKGMTRSSAWTGWIMFGAVMTVMVGMFNVIYGLVALFEDKYYTVGPQGLLVFDLTVWGWIHLIVGAAAVISGIALPGGALWARISVVGLVSLNAITQLVFMSAYPAWSIIAIILDVIVIWAVIVHGTE